MNYLNKRVVLTSKGELSFCGRVLEIKVIDGKEGYLLKTDSINEICIWCPIENVREIITVPILEE